LAKCQVILHKNPFIPLTFQPLTPIIPFPIPDRTRPKDKGDPLRANRLVSFSRLLFSRSAPKAILHRAAKIPAQSFHGKFDHSYGFRE
jgi:hypothetical protein